MSEVKDKERLLKVAREKQLIMYKEAPIRLLADFSAETMKATREWHNTFKVLRKNTENSQDYSTQQTDHSELR